MGRSQPNPLTGVRRRLFHQQPRRYTNYFRRSEGLNAKDEVVLYKARKAFIGTRRLLRKSNFAMVLAMRYYIVRADLSERKKKLLKLILLALAVRSRRYI